LRSGYVRDMPPEAKQIVLIHGNDEFQVEQESRAVLEERCAEAKANGALHTLEGDVDTIDAALELLKEVMTAVQSFNMFSPVNATWIKESTFLTGAVFKSQDVKESVESFQELLTQGLGPEQFLLLSIKGKLAASSRFLKAIKQVADVREFSKSSKPWELEKETLAQVQMGLKSRGISGPARVVEEVAARIGTDSRRCEQELEKLDLSLGDRREITLRDVEDMISAQAESQIFQLADCLASKDLNRCMDLLARLETQGASAIAVIATLHNSIREMAYLRGLLARQAIRLEGQGRFGKLIWVESEAKEDFQRMLGDKSRSPFRLHQLARQSMAFSVSQMDRMVRASSETYAGMFRSRLPQMEQIRILILKVISQCVPLSA